MKNKIITVFAICVFAYFVGSFVAASFNINNWSELLRIVIAGFTCLIILGIFQISYLDSSTSKSNN